MIIAIVCTALACATFVLSTVIYLRRRPTEVSTDQIRKHIEEHKKWLEDHQWHRAKLDVNLRCLGFLDEEIGKILEYETEELRLAQALRIQRGYIKNRVKKVMWKLNFEINGGFWSPILDAIGDARGEGPKIYSVKEIDDMRSDFRRSVKLAIIDLRRVGSGWLPIDEVLQAVENAK